MNIRFFMLLMTVVAPLNGWTQGSYVFISDFAKNGNIQSNLIKEFPTGMWAATNVLATPFDIVTNSAGENFSQVSTPLTNNVFIPAVSTVYTLMNAYAPGSGLVATVEFIGDGGADQVFSLDGGVNVRDFYQGDYVNNINNSTTENAYTITDVQDAGGTGNVNTGLTGTYVVDEQVFALNAAFLTQNLVQIKISGNNNGTPIVLGITARVAPPVISQVTAVRGNLSISGTGGVANTTNFVLSSFQLGLPFSQWTPVATNVLTTSGNFTTIIPNAISLTTPKQFFVLQTQ